jgi:sarcosine oxidase subunit gamma
MDKRLATTALNDSPLEREHFRVAENTDRGLLRLQTFHRTPDAVGSLSQRLGIRLPAAGETVAEQGMRWFWSAPGEWVITAPAEAERDTARALQEKLDGLFVVLSVMTDSRVVLDISGESARNVLARGSTVDFHPASFGAGQCVNTRFAGVSVMIAQLEAGSFLLFADRSLGAYLRAWFDAASVSC